MYWSITTHNRCVLFFFFFNDTATTEIYTLSLHDALPISFELSFFVPENIFKELTNICENYDLLKNLYQKYFEYRHIQNRVDRTKTLWDTLTNQPSPPQHMQRKYANERDGTAELIRGNIKGSFDTYNSIVGELKGSKEHALVALAETYLDEKYDYFQNSPEVQTAATQHGINLQARKKYY